MLNNLLIELNISEEKIQKLNDLREIVLEHNKTTNLTSITDEEQFNVKHILDSLAIIKYYDLNNKKIIDVGSGGGFPGLALAIVLDDSEITMLDSNNKKIEFIDTAINKLGLTNAKTIYSRVEESNLSEEFDVVVSRAVASLNILLEITSPLVKKDGLAIYYKGPNIREEIPKRWVIVERELGMKENSIEEFELIEGERRSFISFKKFSKTKEGYPRIYSKIKNNPIY